MKKKKKAVTQNVKVTFIDKPKQGHFFIFLDGVKIGECIPVKQTTIKINQN